MEAWEDTLLRELYKFIRDGSKLKFELVISLNGINELPNYAGPNAEEFAISFLSKIQHDMNKSQSWIDQRVSGNYINKIALILFLHKLFGQKQYSVKQSYVT